MRAITFSVNGRLACTVEKPPFACAFEPGDVVRGHHIRVVATLTDGRRLVDNVRTKELGYTERIRTEAVLVPVIVTDGGQFVRGLKQQDFEVFEDGVAQPIASLVSEDAPLDLVLAIDVSGSMEKALGRGEAGGQAAAVAAPAGRRGHARRLQRHDVHRRRAREGPAGARGGRRPADLVGRHRALRRDDPDARHGQPRDGAARAS